MSKAYVVLENGRIFEGESFGAEPQGRGELVFTTGVVGYIEALSDPRCFGQIINFTFPQIGNYGINADDMESPICQAAGIIVRQWCNNPSNFRSEENIDSYLKRSGVPAVCGVDTREITRVIREYGSMPALILPYRPEAPFCRLFEGTGHEDAVSRVGGMEKETLHPQGKTRFKVALIDYGAKKDMVVELLDRSCEIRLFPHDTSAGDILDISPDGVALSGGPGDPRTNPYRVEQIKRLLGKVPIFGLGLGHQLMALAAGGEVIKLKYGHRGANQPVREMLTGQVFISSQNHGFEVSGQGLGAIGAGFSYINVNDGGCEGLVYPELQAHSLQFFPRIYAGPRKPLFSLDRFISMMEGSI